MPDSAIAEVGRKARDAELTVLVVGENSLRFGKEKDCGENADRSDIELLGGQLELVKARPTRPASRVVVILVNGRQLGSPWLVENVPAILEAWEPGLQRWSGRLLKSFSARSIPAAGCL